LLQTLATEGEDYSGGVSTAVFRLKHVVLAAKTVKREKRWKLLGKTFAGRYLVVIFTVRRKLFRAVTAYDMNANERRTYAPKID
jgi:uncharacterized DUF497 family protein